MFATMLAGLEALEESLENAAESRTDAEALVRVELANVLARAGVLLGALAADESPRETVDLTGLDIGEGA
jgi:hypothetical protein